MTGGLVEPVAGHEVIKELQDIKAGAAAGSPAQRKASLERARMLQQKLRREWQTGELLYHLGETFGELGAFEEAIYCYEQGLKSWGGDAPIRMVEQLGNLQARYAVQLRQQERQSEAKVARRADQPQPDKLLKQARSRLEWVLAAGQIPERLALLGSFFKRAALVSEGKARGISLNEAEEYYQKAYELSKSAGEVNPYHALNWMTFRWLQDCASKDETRQQELINQINLCLQVATAKANQQTDFWSRVAIPDGNLLLALVSGNLVEREEEIERLYRTTLGAWVTARQQASVREQFDFLIEMLTGSDCEHLLPVLRRIRTAIAE
jgi:tetratricopeptide (TPR) repeat protein